MTGGSGDRRKGLSVLRALIATCRQGDPLRLAAGHPGWLTLLLCVESA